MRRSVHRGVFLLLALAAAVPVAAQSAPAPTGGGTGGAQKPSPTAPSSNPALAPGEPELVLPQVILQIQDLSVENVEAQLPPEENLLPPVRTVPTLSEGELAVGEPTIPPPPVETGGPKPPGNRLVSSDVQLGAGSLALISGSMSLKTIGTDPKFSIQFHHETMDGFAGNKPGSGFNTRTDSLDGGLKFTLGGLGTELAGTFTEQENGLQGKAGGYSSVLSRTISGSSTFSGSPLDWLFLSATASGGFDSLTLQGSAPSPSSEVRVDPSLLARATFGAVKIGLQGDYGYRSDYYLTAGQDELQRIRVAATLSVELPATFIIEGSAGWFLNSAGLSRFPFSVSVTGTPLRFLTLSLEGGYKVMPYDMHDVLVADPLALPEPLVDDRGWYGRSSAQFSLTPDLSATATTAFMASEAMPSWSASSGLDPTTGLFAVTQGSATRFSLDLGLRWAFTQAFSLSAGWSHEFLDRPFFTPVDSLSGGLLGLDPSGRFGGGLTVGAGPLADGTLQLPLLHLSAFWKVIEPVKLQIDGDDLLAPLMSGPRWNTAEGTYVTPGFYLSVSLEISL